MNSSRAMATEVPWSPRISRGLQPFRYQHSEFRFCPWQQPHLVFQFFVSDQCFSVTKLKNLNLAAAALTLNLIETFKITINIINTHSKYLISFQTPPLSNNSYLFKMWTTNQIVFVCLLYGTINSDYIYLPLVSPSGRFYV